MSQLESSNKYDIYYKNLENFSNVNSPSNISSETNTIKKEMSKIKDQLFELGGKGAASAEDVLTDKIKVNQNWDTYAEEALIPSTKKIPDLKKLLEKRKNINTGIYNVEYVRDYYGSNSNFDEYLSNQATTKIFRDPYSEIDEKIDNKISEIRKLAKVEPTRIIDPGYQVLYGPPQALYGPPVIQPAYGIKPDMPIVQPAYGVEPIVQPIVQPAYGIEPIYRDPVIDFPITQPEYGIKPDQPIFQPLYGVKEPETAVIVNQALYGVKDPKDTIIRQFDQALYGVKEPETLIAIRQPVYGVKEPTIRPCEQGLYGVKDPNEPVIRQFGQAVYGVPNLDMDDLKNKMKFNEDSIPTFYEAKVEPVKKNK